MLRVCIVINICCYCLNYGPVLDGNLLAFCFCEFHKILFFEGQKFFRNTSFFQTCKNFAKKVSCFWNQKPCFWVKKFRNPCFGVKNSRFWKFQTYENFGICSIPNFPKITKNDATLEHWKLQKPTRMFGLKFKMQGLSLNVSTNFSRDDFKSILVLMSICS